MVLCRCFFALLLAVAPFSGAHASLFASGFEGDCAADSDGDRLGDCIELALATDPGDHDTDDDGLHDGDEVLGTLDGLDLPAMGAAPRRKQIFVEVDWADDNFGCVAHSHRPTVFALDGVVAMFARAPVANPDGTTGIDLIVDAGQGAPFDGGSVVTLPQGLVDAPTPSSPAFRSLKSANFAPARERRFHYAVFAHAYDFALNYSGGIADVQGDDLMVTTGCHVLPQISPLGDVLSRNFFAHELGHNLGLLHGGNSLCNDVPNYNSVMNYRYARHGVDLRCIAASVPADAFDALAVDFSHGLRPQLDEAALDESAGVCGAQAGVAIDWNKDGAFVSPLLHDLNASVGVASQVATCGGVYSVLSDFDDWSSLVLPAVDRPDAGPNEGPVPECPQIPVGEP